jgi:hypothetical protein
MYKNIDKEEYMKKYTYCFIFGIITTLLSSCLSFEPREDKYIDYTYEQMIKRHGRATYDEIYVVYNDFELSFIAPPYSLYFTEEELENGVQIRSLVWEKFLNNRLLVWLKIIDDQWIVFNSLEYNSTFIQF